MARSASDGISTKVSLLGASEYKKALSNIGNQLKQLSSEMKLTDAAFAIRQTAWKPLRPK